MIDMLVRLYDLPDSSGVYEAVESAGVVLRRPMAYERHIVAKWVDTHFLSLIHI